MITQLQGIQINFLRDIIVVLAPYAGSDHFVLEQKLWWMEIRYSRFHKFDFITKKETKLHLPQ